MSCLTFGLNIVQVAIFQLSVNRAELLQLVQYLSAVSFYRIRLKWTKIAIMTYLTNFLNTNYNGPWVLADTAYTADVHQSSDDYRTPEHGVVLIFNPLN